MNYYLYSKNPRFVNAFQILQILGCILFCNEIVHTQVSSSHHFLQNIGARDTLFSEVLNETREIFVQLPTSYNHDNPEKYPVVYILDGEVLLPTVTNLQDFYSGGFTPEMVLVGISNNKNRTRDLTTSTVTSMYGIPYNQENGKAEQFTNFLESELIPYVYDKYPVTNYRTFIGHSYGGLFAIHTLLHHPELFANYIAIDPSLDWDNQKLLNSAEVALKTKKLTDKSLFLSLGGQLHSQDPTITLENVMQDKSGSTLFARSNIAFSNLVRVNASNGLLFKWKYYPQDIHGTVAFPSIMDGLIGLFEWFQMENTDKFNSPETSIDELKEIINYRADKLKSHLGYAAPPYPEELINILGQMSFDMEQPEKAKMFFDCAIEYYPLSANAYDAMADYYKSQSDNDSALKYAIKAFELSKSDYHMHKIELLKK